MIDLCGIDINHIVEPWFEPPLRVSRDARLHLAHCSGGTVTRGDLRKAVWGYDFDPGTNVIEVHVSRLRAKLHRGFAAPVVLTERGCGYRLAAE